MRHQSAGADESPSTTGVRFLTLQQVAEQLATSVSQVYALVRHRELAAIKIGGRGQWRVEVSALERWIEQQYEATREWIDAHPFTSTDEAAGELPDDAKP